jgi:HlyD family secretion protein
VGQEVDVSFDAGSDRPASATGVVSWIAAEAEFTPTPVQTREERTNLVYAAKVRVPNPEGRLKIGMPADVRLPAGADDRAE